jgi:hypothetical protein
MNLETLNERGGAAHGPEAAAAAVPRAEPEHGREPPAGGVPLVLDARDQRALDWLVQRFGEAAVLEAVGRIPGKRRPYPTNIARVLGAKLPPDAELEAATPEGQARAAQAKAEALDRLRIIRQQMRAR